VTDAGEWFRFLVSALAVWRLTHLLAAEDGPWNLLLRFRRFLGNTAWGSMMDCFNCLSLWIAIPFTFFITDGWLGRLVVWFAASGAACLINRLGTEPIVIQPLDGPNS
jgi:hypothetical protein